VPDDPPKRPTFFELAARGQGGAGIACRRCGCRDLRVLYTRRQGERIMRRRACRHCGERTTTYEKEP